MTKIDTITSMPVRSRLSVDASPELILRLNAEVSADSIKRGVKLTQRDAVLEALAAKYPALAPYVIKELKAEIKGLADVMAELDRYDNRTDNK